MQKLPQALFLRLAYTLVIHQPKPNLDQSSTTILIDTTKGQYQLCVEIKTRTNIIFSITVVAIRLAERSTYHRRRYRSIIHTAVVALSVHCRSVAASAN